MASLRSARSLVSFRSLSAGLHASSAAVIGVLLFTIASELIPAFKVFLAGTFSHHWIGKGVLALCVWMMVYAFWWTFSPHATEQSTTRVAKGLLWTAFVCAILLIGFFAYESMR